MFLGSKGAQIPLGASYYVVVVIGYLKIAMETDLSFLWQTTQWKYGTGISVFFRINIWLFIFNLQGNSMISGEGVHMYMYGGSR